MGVHFRPPCSMRCPVRANNGKTSDRSRAARSRHSVCAVYVHCIIVAMLTLSAARILFRNRTFFYFFFRILSNFNIMKTMTLLVHAGLFWCCHNSPNSDMGYRIFDMHVRSFCVSIDTGDYSLIRRTSVESAQNFTPEKSHGGRKD